MNGVQTRFKCKLDVKRCKRFVFPPSSLLPRSNALKTKAIRYFQTDRTLTRIVSPPLNEEKTTTKFEEEPKHFALYGASESGRDYNTVDMSRLRMYNEYLAPYRAAVDAGAGSIMSSFNVVDAIPATANRWLLTDLLRNEWDFEDY